MTLYRNTSYIQLYALAQRGKAVFRFISTLFYRKKCGNAGSTLLGVIMAMVIASMIFLAFASLFSAIVLTREANEKIISATALAEDVMENIRGIPFSGPYPSVVDLVEYFGESDPVELTDFYDYLQSPLPAMSNFLPSGNDPSALKFTEISENKYQVEITIVWKEILRNKKDSDQNYQIASLVVEGGLNQYINPQ